jgi:hypothetical protein
VTHLKGYQSRRGLTSGPISYPRAANLLRSRFLPGSFGTPSTIQGTRGNRTTANTTQINVAGGYAPPTDSAQLVFVPGSGPGGMTSLLRWEFKTKFVHGPTVVATPVDAPPSVPGATVVIFAISPIGVVMQSSDPLDYRTVHLSATGAPN